VFHVKHRQLEDVLEWVGTDLPDGSYGRLQRYEAWLGEEALPAGGISPGDRDDLSHLVRRLRPHHAVRRLGRNPARRCVRVLEAHRITRRDARTEPLPERIQRRRNRSLLAHVRASQNRPIRAAHCGDGGQATVHGYFLTDVSRTTRKNPGTSREAHA